MSRAYTQKFGWLQEEIFGPRYRGASLSKTESFNTETIDLIRTWHMSDKGTLVMHGPPGTGKTYFCAAILECIPKGIATLRAYKESGLFSKIRSFIGNGSPGGDYTYCLQHLLDDDFIIIDDLGSSPRNDWREEILFQIIDYRYNHMKKTVYTSNLSKKMFNEIYSPRIASRLFAKENTIIDLSDNADLREEGL